MTEVKIIKSEEIKSIIPTCTSKTCESKHFPYCMEGCIMVENVIELK